ncbi:MAG: glycosyltransferase [Actinomycetes bacterium]
MSTVLHYVQRWLPPTEGFVAAVVEGSVHDGRVVSRERPAAEQQRVRRAGSLHRWHSDRAVRLALAARGLQADLVHVHFGYRLRDAQLLLGRRPVVVSLHGHDATAFARAWPEYYAGVLDRAAAVVVPSSLLARRAEQLGARAVHVVPSGVDTRLFAPQPLPRGTDVVFVGRLVEKKGVDVLLRAWPRVRAAVPRARLRVLGSGPLLDLVRRTASDGVEIRPGAMSPLAVRDALARATVVCTPSRTAADGDAESLLLVNLEAQAMGRPVVTTQHGGIPEFLGEGAAVVPENDPGSLADALIRVLTDRALAESMAAAGPATAARFEVRACTRRLDDEVYAPLLSRAEG